MSQKGGNHKQPLFSFIKQVIILVVGNKGMKILVVCQYYYPERFSVTSIAEQLVSFGHDVTVVTGFPNYGYGKIADEYEGFKRNYEVINGVKIHRVKLFSRKESRFSIISNYLSFYFNSRKFLKRFKEKFDIVYSMSISPVTSISGANLFAKKHKIPHILHCLDLWPESLVATGVVKPRGLLYRLFYHISRNLYRDTTRILVSSPSFISYFKDVLQMTKHDLKYVDQPAILADSQGEPFIYQTGTTNIVYAGNIGKVQKIDILLEVAEILKYSKVHFHLIGMGSETERILSEINKRNLQNHIHYHGLKPIEDTIPYFINADALYISLDNSGYVGKTIPNKLIFYLAYKKPIIGAIDNDGKKLLEKTNGAILTSLNAGDIARAVMRLQDMSPSEKEKLGHNNLAYYTNNLTLEKIVHQIENEMFDLIK